MPAAENPAVKECIEAFDEAVMLLERVQRSGEPQALASTIEQARALFYLASKRLAHLQPSREECAMIDNRIARLDRWLDP